MAKVKCPRKLDISVFYQSTRRLFHEDLNYDDERLLIHFYSTFYNESIKLLRRTVRCRVNVLYHLLNKIGKEPNADLFQFMKEASHQRTEEEIEFVFENLGWDYSPVPAPALASKVSLTLDPQPLAQCLYIWGQYINQEKIKLQSIQLYLDC